ncbi:amidohydrolase family protein [Streptomyces xanthophaeus]
MVNGPGGRETADGAVLVDKGVIAAAGPRAAVEAQAGPDVPRLAFPEGTLLPGLDTHVHLALDAGPDPVETLRAATDTELYPGMAERAPRLLGTGVTTVRDLGDRGGLAVRLREEIAAGLLPGPRVLAAGTPLTGPGGHCWFLGGEVEGPDAIRAAVRRNAESGVDLIKVMATGGGITKGGPPVWQAQFTTQELRLVAEEAQRFGLPVAAHAHGTEGIEAAVAAGVDTIEHCTWMSRDGFDVREDLVAEIIDLATTGAAQALGISHDTGRLTAGHRADLLVVDGNPLSDVQALRSVRLVVAGGRPFGPGGRLPRHELRSCRPEQPTPAQADRFPSPAPE